MPAMSSARAYAAVREPPVEDEQDDRRAEQRQRVLNEARNAVGDELVDRLDVIRQAADDHAGAVALIEAERQALQVLEEPNAEVGKDSLADPAGQIRLDVGHAPVRESGRDEDGDDDEEARATVAVHRVVERVLREVGGCERGGCRREEGDDRERRAAAIGACQPPEQREPAARLPPRPVVDRGVALLHEMAAGLVDSHATSSISPRASTASANCRSSSPCS
jgi:hypothetical protein